MSIVGFIGLAAYAFFTRLKVNRLERMLNSQSYANWRVGAYNEGTKGFRAVGSQSEKDTHEN